MREPMFDLTLLRVPTFDGGLIAAFGGLGVDVLAVHLPGALHAEPARATRRSRPACAFLPLTGAIFVIAGDRRRLTTLVPIRWLIGARLRAGRRRAAADARHDARPTTGRTCCPGFIVAGVGAGLINVPLASTAVGVVAPARAGMASGINSTFRQVGIATGVAALGTILA